MLSSLILASTPYNTAYQLELPAQQVPGIQEPDEGHRRNRHQRIIDPSGQAPVMARPDYNGKNGHGDYKD